MMFFNQSALFSTGLFLCCTLGGTLSYANSLKDIQSQIQRQEAKIAQQKNDQAQLQSQLRVQETQINQLINQNRAMQANLDQLRQQIKQEQDGITKLEKKITHQKNLLTRQLDATFRTHNHASLLEQWIKGNPEQTLRMEYYYAHINEARTTLIQALQQNQKNVTRQKRELIEKQQRQQALLSEQKKQEASLLNTQQQREQTLAKLNKNLAYNQSILQSLKENEAHLTQQIQQAQQKAQKQDKQAHQVLQNMNGLGKGQKQYRFPIPGHILHQFGENQIGELRWKGIVIAAPMGTPVHSIAPGRVILANWLQGYGLVVVVDHGKGDMSLYGYNRSVSVKMGDPVNAGQVLAEVGSSGGQGQNALYFEIRQQGNAVNPINWIK